MMNMEVMMMTLKNNNDEEGDNVTNEVEVDDVDDVDDVVTNEV